MPSGFYVHLIQLLLLVQAFGLAGCKDSPVEPTPVVTPLASIDLEPATPALARGQQLQLAAIPKSATGQTLTDRPVLWVSLDPTVVSVTPQGLATALTEASATLQVTAGGLTRELEIEVGPPAVTNLSLDNTQLILDEGGSGQLTVTARNALGEEVSAAGITWTSLSEEVASVVGGTVTAHAEGSSVIRVSLGGVFIQALVQVRPDFGGELVFVSADGPFGAQRMYQVDPRNYATKRPVFDDNGNWHPAISPDGQRIVWTCVASGPGICVSDLDGGNYARLTDSDMSYEDQPSWSPDGQKIVFRRWTQYATPGPWNPSDIWVMDANGANAVNLTSDANSQHWPRWSPVPVDGAYRIAFVQDSVIDGYETSRIAMMRADGSDRRFLTEGFTHVEVRPTWTPDGSSLLFTRNGGGFNGAILSVNVATGAMRQFLTVSLPTGGQFHPTVSPNGRYVAFASQHEEVDGAWVPQIYTARIDGTDVRRRSSGTHGKGEFSWVPTP
jgi:Tol biopolymer transport system component